MSTRVAASMPTSPLPLYASRTSAHLSCGAATTGGETASGTSPPTISGSSLRWNAPWMIQARTTALHPANSSMHPPTSASTTTFRRPGGLPARGPVAGAVSTGNESCGAGLSGTCRTWRGSPNRRDLTGESPDDGGGCSGGSCDMRVCPRVRRALPRYWFAKINTSKVVTSTNVHSAQVMALLIDR